MEKTGCDAILENGIYDIDNSRSEVEMTKSFVSWFKSLRCETVSDYEKSGISVNIPIAELLVGISGSSESEQFKEFKNQIEKYVDEKSSFHKTLQKNLKVINSHVVEAWSKCKSSVGLHFTFKILSDKTFVLLCTSTKLQDFSSDEITIGVEGNVKANGKGNFFDEELEPKSFEITPGDYQQMFTRLDSDEVTIVITASFGMSEPVTLHIPKINPPKAVNPLVGQTFTHKRTLGKYHMDAGTGTDITGRNSTYPMDKDRILVEAPVDGVYDIEARGTYQNDSWSDLYVFFSIFANTNKVIHCEQAANGIVNNFPGPALIKTIYANDVHLTKGDKIELRFGNNGSPTADSQGFFFAHPDDFISITLTNAD